MGRKTIRELLTDYTREWMSLPGVLGTAQGLFSGKPCIKVFVIQKTVELNKRIPDTLEGYPVIIEESEEFEALPENQS